MADGTIYERQALTNQEIRLLVIEASDCVSDLIRCRLFCIDLEAIDTPSYEALSYVWGDATRRANISCNGVCMSVTENLADALKRLRLPREPRLVWADAICINQKSNLEKNRQIPLMGKIYSMAQRVVVWLGSMEADESEAIHQTVQRLANHIRTEREKDGFDETNTFGYDTIKMPHDYTSTTNWNMVKCLYAMPWFSRIWCVQEIVLGKDGIMLLGEHEILWANVGMIAVWLEECVPVRANDYDEHAFYAGIEVRHANSMYSIQRKQFDLFDLLYRCYDFGASNPRDRVYGILSIVHSQEESKALRIDYNKSVGEVYADAVVASIQHNESLLPLCFVDHGQRYEPSDEGFTSWTPKWSQIPRRIPAFEASLSACKKRPVSWIDACDVNSERLCVEGIFYSRLDSVEVEMNLENLEQGPDHPFVDIFCTMVSQQGMNLPREWQRLEILARTLTAGCDSAREDLSDADLETRQNFVASFVMCIERLARGQGDASSKLVPQEDTFYEEAEIVCTGRRIFRTANGDFGLGPGAARPGDIAVVLFGGDSIYILRPHKRSYYFIGQAYIDSLMQGKLVDEMEMGLACKQEFCLI